MSGVPSSASDLLPPSELIVGDPDEPMVVARYLGDVSAELGSFTAQLGIAQSQLGTQSGVGVLAIQSKIENAPIPGARVLETSAVAARQAFLSYASSLNSLNNEGRAVLTRVDGHLGVIRVQSSEIEGIGRAIGAWASYAWDQGAPLSMPGPGWGSLSEVSDDSERVRESNRLQRIYGDRWQTAAVAWESALGSIQIQRRRWMTLIEQRRAAERSLVASLRQTSLGELAYSPAARGGAMRSVVMAGMFGAKSTAGAAAARPKTSHRLLTKLIGDEDGADVWNNPPSPVEVSRNWARLTAAEQNTLIAQVPWVIGNLPGLPYAVRDRANLKLIDFYDANRAGLSARSLTALDQLKTIADPNKRKNPPVYVVSLNLEGEVPMVATGYGHLDSANFLTAQVAGMESDADKALTTWHRASRNLYTEQVNLLTGKSTKAVGVIVFLSYDTPDLADSVQVESGKLKAGKGSVLSSGLARQGASRIAAEFDGMWAARNQPLGVEHGFTHPDSPRIAVIGHSYGTTTVANALMLVKHDVDAFIMLGSAGLDAVQVPSLQALGVVDRWGTGQEIYTAHASADQLAPLGLTMSGRGNPNPGLKYENNLNYEGAGQFSVEGYTTSGGEVYKPTDGHSVLGDSIAWHNVLGHGKNTVGFEASQDHGYMDQKTQSLRNASAASLGLTSEVLGGVSYAK